MTIKEIAEQTGMSKANIRFYESEGLLTPHRKENGYRFYEEEHVLLLLRIKLLRELELPLDAIRKLLQQEISFREVLQQHMDTLLQKRQKMERCREILLQICSEALSIDELDPTVYLQQLEEDTLQWDVPHQYRLPWRRYFARGLDHYLYQTILLVLFPILDGELILLQLLTLAVMLLTEPLLLHVSSTTVGKTIFGIQITDRAGERLNYWDAMERTWIAVWEGQALGIPLLSLYYQYKSFSNVQNGITLSWERDSDLTFRDDGVWRYGLFAAAYIGILAVNVLIMVGRGAIYG